MGFLISYGIITALIIISGIGVVIAASTEHFAYGDDDAGEAAVFAARATLLAPLWPILLIYIIIAIACNRDPIDLRRRLR